MYAAMSSSESDDQMHLAVAGFGSCTDGQLGVGVVDDYAYTPTFIPSTAQLGADVADIACGAYHTLFLTTNGSVYSCGSNDHGQLCHEGPRRKLGIVTGLSSYKISQVSCGAAHSLALASDGQVFCWGSNEFGQLGTGISFQNSSTIKKVPLSNAVQIRCGSFHSLALIADGRLFSWGRNDDCQLGLGHAQKVDSPQEITSLYGIPLIQIAAGAAHTIVLSASGAVFGWGKDQFGQIGVGDVQTKPYPVQARSLRNQCVTVIACGDNHTAALTKDGRLFTFGAGTYGQLGHGSPKNEIMPKQILDLSGLSISSVACGRCHTIALISKKLYVFGLNGSGQLGIGSTQSRLTPTLVQSNVFFYKIFAGGDHSFALSSNRDYDGPVGQAIERKPVKHLDIDMLKNLLTKDFSSVIKQELEIIFTSLPCINYSFLQTNAKRYGANKNNPGVDMDSVMNGFELLTTSSHAQQLKILVVNCLERGLLKKDIHLKPPDVEALRIFIILPWCPAFTLYTQYKKLHVPFATALLRLENLPLQVIEQWWFLFELRHLNRVLKIFKNAIIHILVDDDCRNDKNSLSLFLEILSRLNRVNTRNRKLPFDSFYINELADKVDIRADYANFILKPDVTRFTFCKYPFIFNAHVKSLLLETDAAITQHLQVQETNIQNIQSLFMAIPQQSPFLTLIVSRQNLVQDTIDQLLGGNPNELKKPLKVKFRGEEADDAGGVRKEFFMLLFMELLHPKYGMFVEYEGTRRLWFSTTVFEGDVEMFQLIGVLVGLAIYNCITIALPFPLALYKKLLKQPPTLDDLKELSPVEGRSLEALADYENDDFEDVFALTFEISTTSFGQTKNVELKPGGASIAVNRSNKHEYIDLYVNYKLNVSVQVPFQAFDRGFHRAVNSRVLQFFQPMELMEMVVGNENYDWDEFERNCEYRGEYWANHPTIKMFWKVFRSLTLDQRKKFLLFLTGSDRVPLLGMKQIKMYIQPTFGGDSFYPAAHTCFNLLDLPKYTIEENLRSKLLGAIEHTQGFTLV